MPSTTRGPLPPAVYWRRRLAVLSVALVIFLGVGKLLGNGSDGASQDTAEQAGATATSPPVSPTATVTEGGKDKLDKGGRSDQGGQGEAGTPTPSATPTPTPPPLPDPTGPCPDSDVLVTATVPAPVGGSDITMMLNLQTSSIEACTWQVSPETIRMQIVSGPDRIWSTRQCPDAVPTQDVVVRLASVTQVPVVWSSRRSDDECSDRTAWALPGSYHVLTTALGGEPTDVQFELVPPTAPTVTQTVQPQGGKGKGKGKGNRNGNSG